MIMTLYTQIVGVLTNLDVAAPVEEHIVALDVAVHDALRVQVLQALARLSRVSQSSPCH